MKFQDKLQILRKEKALSQEKLANLIGLSDLFRVSIDHLVKEHNDENCLFDSVQDHLQPDNSVVDFRRFPEGSSEPGASRLSVSGALAPP